MTFATAFSAFTLADLLAQVRDAALFTDCVSARGEGCRDNIVSLLEEAMVANQHMLAAEKIYAPEPAPTDPAFDRHCARNDAMRGLV